jgi:hypothetical protein
MGMDPPKRGEGHEVTIRLDGEVSKEAFDEYKKRLRKCLDELAKLTDPPRGRKGRRRKKLQVRQVGALIVVKRS